MIVFGYTQCREQLKVPAGRIKVEKSTDTVFHY